MTLFEKSPVLATVLWAVIVFAIEAVGLYVMDKCGSVHFSWGMLLVGYGSSMYLLIGGISVIGMRYTKLFYAIGVPLLLVLCLAGSVMEYGMVWMSPVFAAVIAAVTVLLTLVPYSLSRRNNRNNIKKGG